VCAAQKRRSSSRRVGAARRASCTGARRYMALLPAVRLLRAKVTQASRIQLPSLRAPRPGEFQVRAWRRERAEHDGTRPRARPSIPGGGASEQIRVGVGAGQPATRPAASPARGSGGRRRSRPEVEARRSPRAARVADTPPPLSPRTARRRPAFIPGRPAAQQASIRQQPPQDQAAEEVVPSGRPTRRDARHSAAAASRRASSSHPRRAIDGALRSRGVTRVCGSRAGRREVPQLPASCGASPASRGWRGSTRLAQAGVCEEVRRPA
jgi:hypothetical protein